MKKFLIIILLLPIVVWSCEKNNDPTGSEFTVSVDQEFQVELTSNPSTGYSWQWVNEDMIDIVDSTDYTFITDTPVIGSPGTDIWTFKGIKSGTDSIKMEYTRSWEDEPPLETKTIVVKVK